MWKVLIIESDIDGCQHIAHGLHRVAQCKAVSDGRAAITAYQDSIRSKKYFDFIILELTIEPLTGFEIIQHIRNWEDSPSNKLNWDVKIIVVSAYHDSLLNKYNIGWDDYITKPLEVDKMIHHMMALKTNKANHPHDVSLQHLLVL